MAKDTGDGDGTKPHRTLDTAEISKLGDDALIDTRQAGALIGASPVTLAQWRCHGHGAPFIRLKHSRTIRYRVGDVRKWIAAQTIGAKQ